MMTEGSFVLEEKVVLVSGVRRGAIYDLRDGAVYSVDEHSKAFLAACEKVRPLSKLFAVSPEFSSPRCMAYLDKLVASKLGRYCDAEEILKRDAPPTISPQLEFVWLEVTAGCNLRCIHCYEEGCPSLIGSERMTVGDWQRVIDEASRCGCKKLQFIGGEPLLLGDDLIILIEYARTIGFAFIEVFTNATLLTEKFVSAFIANNVHVAISFYGESSRVHELVTLSPGSHKSTLSGIKKIMDAGCELRVAVVGMRQNEAECERTIAYLKEIGVKTVRFDVVRPSGRGASDDVVSPKLLDSVIQRKPIFRPCTEDVFQRRIRGHNCFLTKICVSASGAVYPCIMERRISYGNVLEDSLLDILNGSAAMDVRELSKDKIAVCRDCEYRYACADCRPRATAGAEGPFAAKPQECLYDPYSGIWGK
jgi:radical SAM protein with 4Fe4S-binding SPASM domain